MDARTCVRTCCILISQGRTTMRQLSLHPYLYTTRHSAPHMALSASPFAIYGEIARGVRRRKAYLSNLALTAIVIFSLLAFPTSPAMIAPQAAANVALAGAPTTAMALV